MTCFGYRPFKPPSPKEIFKVSNLAHQSFMLGSQHKTPHLIIKRCFALLQFLTTYLPLGLLKKISSRTGLWYSLVTQPNTTVTASQFQHNLQKKKAWLVVWRNKGKEATSVLERKNLYKSCLSGQHYMFVNCSCINYE